MRASSPFRHRRLILQGAASLGLISGWSAKANAAGAAAPASAAATTAPSTPSSATAVPMSDVRLLPSFYADALQANQSYLLRLSADRFLHNYHLFAGLPVKGPIYGSCSSSKASKTLAI